jgi:hypothetical protein
MALRHDTPSITVLVVAISGTFICTVYGTNIQYLHLAVVQVGMYWSCHHSTRINQEFTWDHLPPTFILCELKISHFPGSIHVEEEDYRYIQESRIQTKYAQLCRITSFPFLTLLSVIQISVSLWTMSHCGHL